ncbi:MAG: restriction endonuclease subunit R [Haliscomenobacteraceae bacterium CHB4]|nr:restriction endonuclease subunit R [Haliscomenobacteraceae bacterium CHB4]
MNNKSPEQHARDRIDVLLQQSGWAVQDRNGINWSAGLGIAVREYPTSEGPADYILFVDRKPVGVIEAKREEKGESLATVEDQSQGYRSAKLQYLDNAPLPFAYESNGEVTWFTDHLDPKPRSRREFSFHRPETFREWLKQPKSLRARLQELPPLDTTGLRDCQVKAIHNLETSFKSARPRALIQMATGSGKTFTAITFIYRLLKFADAKRILFLVDTKNLGEQAEQEFMAFEPTDDKRKFTELYTVQRLNSPYISPGSHVCISTIQRLYSILKDEDLDEQAEQENPNERWLPKEPLPVVYNEKIPPEFFDFIVIDECHRSIYNLWKQVLDYFDAFLVGLTATPDARTFGFFRENVVSEYTHEQAVLDGVNVGYNVYLIETKITKEGATVNAGEYIERREKLSRRKRWELLDEEESYSATALDRDVVNPSQIRRVIRTFRDKLPEIFPHRREVPKTLIFAKTDSHAEDIIRMVREEFGEGNEFCKKITYQSKEAPKSVLAQFRNEYNPRIAVTVDMIATGTDVKPLECLLFMRDVKSRNYFEQMKGRGTRTLGEDDLRKVTPSAASGKTHFVIVDAVGVTKTLKTDSRPLERRPSASLKDLLGAVLMGARDEDLYTSLANRLIRLDRQLDEQERSEFRQEAGGKTASHIAAALLAAYDPDRIEEKAREMHTLPADRQPEAPQLAEAQEALIEAAGRVFSGPLNEYIENLRRVHEQLLDHLNLDELRHAGWDTSSGERGAGLIEGFREYIETYKDEVAAFRIFYEQPYQQRHWTYRMVKEILEHLKRHRPQLAPFRIYEAYAELDNIPKDQPKSELIALVAILRRELGLDARLDPWDEKVRRNFQDWAFRKQAGALKFTEEQMDWLRMIRDHIAASVSISEDDLDFAPFDAKGGRGKMWQLFEGQTTLVINELNKELVA